VAVAVVTVIVVAAVVATATAARAAIAAEPQPAARENREAACHWSHFFLLSTPADPGFWLRFRSGPVLTYPRTLRSGPRESLARNQAERAGS
jgi:hypothetical protein